MFCDSFLCSISLLLLSDFLSCVLNSVYTINVIVHILVYIIIESVDSISRDEPDSS